MAVYTHLDCTEIESMLARYDLGTLVSYHGITQGIENTNYLVVTDRKRLILTVFEKRIHPDRLPAIFEMQKTWLSAGIACPHPYADKGGQIVQSVRGKAAAFISFLSGQGADAAAITAEHTRQLGAELARMHSIKSDFSSLEQCNSTPVFWRELIEKTGAVALDQLQDGLYDQLISVLDRLDAEWPNHLPKNAIHADLFPDNVFYHDDGQFAGVIDFYFSHYGILIYDLAVVIHAWCADVNGVLHQDRLDALMMAYQEIRLLSSDEQKALPFMLKAAALRFLCTRAYDWYHTPEGADVVKKDPMEYAYKFLNCGEWV